MNELGEYLRNQRELRGWTQADAADRFGISKSYLSRVELGAIKLPSVEIRRQIAAVLNIRHIDMLVLAGELSREEIEGSGAARNPFAPDDPRSLVVERLMIDDELLGAVLAVLAFADRERGVSQSK